MVDFVIEDGKTYQGDSVGIVTMKSLTEEEKQARGYHLTDPVFVGAFVHQGVLEKWCYDSKGKLLSSDNVESTWGNIVSRI